MRKFRALPPAEQLHQLFHYDHDTGILYWRKPHLKLAGSAGRRGYWRIMVNYRTYSRHRLVWAYFNGDPDQQIVDHINRDRLDDRIENLRLATESENRRSSRMYRTNTSGFKGVTCEARTKKWKAYIYANNKRKHLGMFNSKLEAAAAYQRAALELHGAFVGEFT